jgi:hypothetical protein
MAAVTPDLTDAGTSLGSLRRRRADIRGAVFRGFLITALTLSLVLLVALVWDMWAQGSSTLTTRLGSFLTSGLNTNVAQAGVWQGIKGSLLLGVRDHRADRSVRLRQEHAAAQLQPDERPHRERRGSRAVRYHGGPLRPGGRPGRGPAPDRDGLPEAEPVPEVDLRQRRLRPAVAGFKGRLDDSSSGRCARPRCGTRSRTSSSRRPTACPAASSSGCASPGRSPPSPRSSSWTSRARRSTRSPRLKIEDLMRELKQELHDRHRHPQHAAGGSGQRQDGVLHLQSEEDDRRSGRLIEFDLTEKIFRNPSDSRTEDYVTGRFG